MKNKIKQMVCMICVFVVSFMLTATAFAESAFVIQNNNYFGYYDAVNNSRGLVTVREEFVKMGVYEYDEDLYMYGTSTDGALTSEYYAFTFAEAHSSDRNGIIDTASGKIMNLTVTGKTEVKLGGFLNLFIKTITLIPDGHSNEQYVLEK